MKYFALIVILGLLVLPACFGSKKTNLTAEAGSTVGKAVDPATLEMIRAVTSAGADFGLCEWGKKDPASAKECANNLSKNINDQLIPYLDQKGTLTTTAEMQQLLQTSIFDKVPPVVKSALIAASSLLDYYLPCPEVVIYTTPNQVAIVKAFLLGLKDGCDKFDPTKVSAKTWVK